MRDIIDVQRGALISFELGEQEVMGLVGESGCGTTTVGRALLRLYGPTDSEVLFHRADGSWVDLAKISHREMKDLRKEMRMIFQDPFSSLNPGLTVRDIIAEPLVIAMAIFLAANRLVSLAVVALRGEERTIPFANRLVARLFGSEPALKLGE